MITNIHAENFKSWKNLNLKTSKITGLFGANSSGKSSILQLLLMLKQTKEATDRTLVLDFGGANRYTNLGSFSEVAHNHSEEYLNWEISWTLPKALKVSDPLGSSRSVLFETKDLWTQATVTKTKNKVETSRLFYGIGIENNSPAFSLAKGLKGYELSPHNFNYKFVRNQGRAWEIPAPVKSYNFPDQVQTYYKNTAFLSELAFEYEQLMDGIFYLGPLRDYPQREYTWSGSKPADVGKRGERAVDAILAAVAQGKKRNLGYRRPLMAFDHFIARWLKDLGLIHDFGVREIADGTGLYRVWIKKTPYSAEALITDVGFGVSQILPILVLLFYVPERSIVILEQPEIHLHPAVQANLADAIICATQTRDIQVIFESHSEHLLRRIQRRVAENTISRDNISLHFCSMAHKQSKLTPLQLDLFGNISNWPEDFFGDAFGEVAAMQKAALKRKMSI